MSKQVEHMLVWVKELTDKAKGKAGDERGEVNAVKENEEISTKQVSKHSKHNVIGVACLVTWLIGKRVLL